MPVNNFGRGFTRIHADFGLDPRKSVVSAFYIGLMIKLTEGQAQPFLNTDGLFG